MRGSPLFTRNINFNVARVAILLVQLGALRYLHLYIYGLFYFVVCDTVEYSNHTFQFKHSWSN